MGTAATTITATFSAKPLTGWSWTYKDAAIPNVVELYIGEYARFDIAGYTPSDVINDKKGFVYVAAGDPSTMQPVYNTDDLAHVGHSTNYYTIRGKRATESTTVVFKSTGNSELMQTMTLRIKALPVVHFKDLVHGEVFADVAATVTTGVVTKSKPTPTHDDWSGSPKNTCETGHVHLVGWIDSEWAEEYLSDDAMPNKATIEASGYFYAPNAAIDTEANNGKTFYAVWSTIEDEE
jgi:hypothetical protein